MSWGAWIGSFVAVVLVAAAIKFMIDGYNKEKAEELAWREKEKRNAE